MNGGGARCYDTVLQRFALHNQMIHQRQPGKNDAEAEGSFVQDRNIQTCDMQRDHRQRKVPSVGFGSDMFMHRSKSA